DRRIGRQAGRAGVLGRGAPGRDRRARWGMERGSERGAARGGVRRAGPAATDRRGPAGALTALLGPLRSVKRRLLEGERVALPVDGHRVALRELAAEQTLGELVLDVALDRAFQRASAVLRIPALIHQEGLRHRRDREPEPAPREALLEELELDVH